MYSVLAEHGPLGFGKYCSLFLISFKTEYNTVFCTAYETVKTGVVHFHRLLSSFSFARKFKVHTKISLTEEGFVQRQTSNVCLFIQPVLLFCITLIINKE